VKGNLKIIPQSALCEDLWDERILKEIWRFKGDFQEK